jgi:uncharacterized Zn finger protein
MPRSDDRDRGGFERGGFERFGPSTPIKVEGGIATSKQRGAMAERWWSQRFVQVLESYGLGGRMQRGRRYARTGQVLSLDVSPGLVRADVQGSRPQPYSVVVRFAEASDEQWESILQAMAQRAGFAAHLLDGEVPADLEAVFADAGVPLFPAQWAAFDASCSCPDWGNPCKHLAAVLYVLADRFDADPWLLLAWRGRLRESLLERLLGSTGAAARDPRLPAWWPLPPGASAPPGSAVVAVDASAPDPPDAVLRRLPDLDVDVAGTPLANLLPEVYRRIVG